MSSYHLSVLGNFGSDVLEEFLQSRIMKTLLLPPTGRKWREKNTLGGSGKWQVEVGEPTSPLLGALESELIKESSSNVCKGLQTQLHLKLPSLVLTAVIDRSQITHRPKRQLYPAQHSATNLPKGVVLGIKKAKLRFFLGLQQICSFLK